MDESDAVIGFGRVNLPFGFFEVPPWFRNRLYYRNLEVLVGVSCLKTLASLYSTELGVTFVFGYKIIDMLEDLAH